MAFPRNTAFWVILVVAILGIAYFIWAQEPGPINGNGNGDGGPPAGGEQTVSFRGVNFAVPTGFGLAVSEEQILVESVIPPCDRNFNYCVYFIGTEYEDTNFASAGVRIEFRDDLPAESSCLRTQPRGFTGLVPQVSGREEYAVSVFSPVGGGAAGHVATGSLYRLFFDGTCVEFETRAAQAQFANFEPGTIEEFTESDEAQVRSRLRGVLESVRLREGSLPVSFPSGT